MQKSDSVSTKINSASLIDLKAELYRKQEEYKVQKLANQNEGYIKGKPSSSNKKPTIWSKKNKGVSERSEKDYEEKLEEEDVFERSKKSLENKAKLYNKIANSSEVPEEDGSNFYLVDFQKKVIEDKQDQRKRDTLEKETRERQEAEEDRLLSEKPVPEPATPSEEWVDYTDCLGRSRRCLRADLPSLQQKDKELNKSKIDKSNKRDLMSSDMHRENERQEWEKEEEEEKMKAEKEGPIHYGDVLHNEIRTHGTAFYKFDTDEETRKEQMDELMNMRQETKDERSKSERIKAKRKAALAARLSKVKQRKRGKLGLPEEEDEEPEEEIGPTLDEAEKVVEPLTRDDDEWRKEVKSSREWDKGKQSIPERSEQAWLEKQRSERFDDFAPPTFYYTDKTPSHNNQDGKTFKAMFDSDGKKKQTSSQQSQDSKTFKTPLDSDCKNSQTNVVNQTVDNTGNTLNQIIVKQLSQMRSEFNRNTEPLQPDYVKNESNTNDESVTSAVKIEGSYTNQSAPQRTMSDFINRLVSTPQSFNMAPPPTFEIYQQPMNINVPPPPLLVGGQAQPPFPVNMSIPPVPVPPPFPVQMSHPPPIGMPEPSYVDDSLPPPSWNMNANMIGMNQQYSEPLRMETPANSVSLTNPVAPSEPKKKLKVLDTRFMQHEDT